ncbi:YaaR family protein [Clostridium hydrogeniformans]|uniref:YaaR family protein n=1 Tax=Clostridium hydrogeniformans TaxID=349933 RepID=UPI0004875174|nr:YaaR family protein [Clostridium hydrogeniformans]
MEISRVRKGSSLTSERKKVDLKKDFSQSFNFAKERKSEEELKKMLEDINKRGNRLAITKCFADVRVYKNLIRDYLKTVLNHMYSIKKDISFWQTQYFVTVDIIDQKLEELTNMIMEGEKENISVASTIDEIQGLIVDIYK